MRRILGLLAAALLTSCAQEPRPWNVLLITMDTTRADYLGAYGRDDATTPVIDALAERGYLFEWAHTSNPVTQAAHSTILTGLYPLMHGVRDNGLFRLPDEVDTLAEHLKAAGYATGAAIGGFPLVREFGTDQGFDFYDDELRVLKQDHRGRRARDRRPRSWYDERPATHVNDAIMPFLDAREQAPAQPFFVWLHYWDPHEPHIAPPPFAERYAHDSYQGEIAFTDAALGQLLDRLDAMGELERTLIVLTADHGESRREHNELTHAFMAYDSSMHVPLIIATPGPARGVRIAEDVGTVDIVPTVLDLLDLPLPETLQGRSLVGLMNGDTAVEREVPIYAESMSPKLTHGFGALRVLYDGGYKYIHGPIPEMYAFDDDPQELRDLYAADPTRAAQMEARLATVIDWYSGTISAAYEFDEDTIQRLAGLGYLNMAGGETEVDEKLSRDGVPPQAGVGMINTAFRVRSLLGNGDYYRALPLIERLIDGAPQQPYYRGQWALALTGTDQIERAVEVVETTEVINSANVDSFAAVARALEEQGQSARALQLISRLYTAAPTARTAMAKAALLKETAEPDVLLAHLEDAHERFATDPNLRVELARSWIAADNDARAAPVLRELLDDYPALPAAHLGLAELYRVRGDAAQAHARLERTLRLAPGLCEAHETRLRWRREDGLEAPTEPLPAHCEEAV